jgi:3-oxoacyl-[acyl-carrier protein] reductase
MKTNDYLVRWSKKGWFRSLAKNLGIPTPVELRRLNTAFSNSDFAGKNVEFGGGALAPRLQAWASGLGAKVQLQGKLDLLVFDASELASPSDLDAVHEFFSPRMRRVAAHGRVIVLGQRPETCSAAAHAAAQSGLSGLARSLAKELGRKAGYAHLLRLPAEGCQGLEGALHFFASEHSSFVTGRVVDLEAAPAAQLQGALQGKRVLVTGSGRGIGKATAARLAREGAKVMLLDRPDDLALVEAAAKEIGAEAFALDIAAEDAPARLVAELEARGGVDVVVHNAGITRDKTMGRMSTEQWQLCLDVNLAAVMRLNEALLAGPMAGGGNLIFLSSISGLAGNVGQTNYATAKAGLAGLAAHMANQGQVRCNAVAPGFIETRMTAKLPFTLREGARRMAALKQGGLPDDVGALVTFLASPASAAVNGQTIRVCGGSLIGA